MKKVFILFIAALLLFSAAGCGIKQKIENKIGEKITEKVLESGTDAKVDISGDKVTVKGEDGTEVTFGGNEWPKSDLVKDVPKFDKGTIISVTDSEEFVMIMLEGVEKKDFQSYWENIKGDYTEETFSLEADDVISYAGGNGKGVYVQLAYNTSDSTFTIGVTKKEQ